MEEKENQEKRIETCDVSVSELVDNIGNPRKISSVKRKELEKSLEMFGDFGIIVIDENNNIISGHQRVAALRAIKGDDAIVHCKRLIGYTVPELKAINIKANTHAGDWDMNKLAEWTAQLQINLGLDIPLSDANEREIKGMEPIRFEKHDYVMIVCKTSTDYEALQTILGLVDKKTIVGHNKKGYRTVGCRAMWFDEFMTKIKEYFK